MTDEAFQTITQRYPELRLAVVGDFCLDRYLEIDPAREEVSIETGRPVHNVVNVRSQPGGAGTIVNNLVALGIRQVDVVGFCGQDGEGMELCQALKARPGVCLEHFLETPERRTFTYCKPLLMHAQGSPEELNRLDSKNWTPTPEAVSARLVRSLETLLPEVDGIVLLDQVDEPGTGVLTAAVQDGIQSFLHLRPELLILADSRQGLQDFPPVQFKMNLVEFKRFQGWPEDRSENLADLQATLKDMARDRGQNTFVTMAEQGMIGANAAGEVAHVPAMPVKGEIDIVGAGDAVTANLAAALAAGATLDDAMQLASRAASIVIHQLGTTGTATVDQMKMVEGEES